MFPQVNKEATRDNKMITRLILSEKVFLNVRDIKWPSKDDNILCTFLYHGLKKPENFTLFYLLLFYFTFIYY